MSLLPVGFLINPVQKWKPKEQQQFNQYKLAYKYLNVHRVKNVLYKQKTITLMNLTVLKFYQGKNVID